MELRWRDGALALDRVAVIGILNVTPDSFSDGGLWLDPRAAVAHGRAMAEQGAAIIDVGGESTRPDAEPVAEVEELRRVIPVIEALAGDVDVPISIDTRKPAVARRALAAGASIVNDTLGEARDPAIDELVAESGGAIVVMHSRGTPATMRSLTDYDDVVSDVALYLEKRVAALEEIGVSRDSIAVDPGFGFAKTPPQNLVLLRRLDEIVALGLPVLVGTSRKSFIGAILDLPEDRRTEGSVATAVWAVAKGARLVRVHDVEPTMRALKVVDAIRGA